MKTSLLASSTITLDTRFSYLFLVKRDPDYLNIFKKGRSKNELLRLFNV